MRKEFDGHPFSPHEIIVSFPIEWGGQTIIMDVEVIDAPIDYNFLFIHSLIHAIMAIVSSESRVIRFPHWGKFVMIEQLYYYMIKIVVRSNVPFIRDGLKEVQYIKVESLKNDSLMGYFMIT